MRDMWWVRCRCDMDAGIPRWVGYLTESMAAQHLCCDKAGNPLPMEPPHHG